MRMTSKQAEELARHEWLKLYISSGRLGVSGLLKKESAIFGLRQKFAIKTDGPDLYTHNDTHIGEFVSYNERHCVIKIYPKKWALTRGASVRPYLSDDYYGTLYLKMIRNADEIIAPGSFGDIILRGRNHER